MIDWLMSDGWYDEWWALKLREHVGAHPRPLDMQIQSHVLLFIWSFIWQLRGCQVVLVEMFVDPKLQIKVQTLPTQTQMTNL